MGKVRDMFKKNDDKYPMMEFAAPRRVQARPMSENSAEKEGILNAFPDIDEAVPEVNREGFHVKDGIGAAMHEYWMPKALFEPNHIRTNMLTIGEVPIMLLSGTILKRQFWPNNQFIMYRNSVDLDIDLKQTEATKVPAFAKMEGFVAKVTIHADPLRKDKFNIHVEPWTCTQDDIFAKDYQIMKIDLNNLGGVDKKKK